MKAIRVNVLAIRLGGMLILCLLVPSGLGFWLDHRFEKAPLFALIGALLGIILSTISAVRLTAQAIESAGQRAGPETDRSAGRNGKEDKA